MTAQKNQFSTAGTAIFTCFVTLIIGAYSIAGPIKEPSAEPTNCQPPIETVQGMTIYGALFAFAGKHEPKIVPSELRKAANAYADALGITTEDLLPPAKLEVCLSPNGKQITSIRAI